MRIIERLRKKKCGTGLKNMVKAVTFLLAGLCIFLKIQAVLTPNWNQGELVERIITGVEKLEVRDLDALFLGTSHARAGISPMELYDKYGLLSYSMSTSGQPVACSYFLLEKAYQTHDIRTVVFDVSGLFLDHGDPGWRPILDNIEWSSLKYRMIKAYLENEWSTEAASLVCPMLKYHSNWTGITRDSFYKPEKTYSFYSFGQAFGGMVIPSLYEQEEVDDDTEVLSGYHSGKLVELSNGTITEQRIEKSLYQPIIYELNMKYFLKMVELCEQHGSRLLLIKIPTMMPPQRYSGAWTKVRSEQVRALAESCGLEFLDLQYDADHLLAIATDTGDGGMHPNTLGAIKVSDYLGPYLVQGNPVMRRKHQIYEEALEKYHKMLATVKLQSTFDFGEYLGLLKERKENYSLIVAAAEDYVSGLAEDDLRSLEELGLQIIGRGGYRDSYVGILSKGELIYEAVSDYGISHNLWVSDVPINVQSRNGWIASPGASIRVNGVEYAAGNIGLNFVVYDHETGRVIDSTVFDTSNAAKECTRNQQRVFSFLMSYESVLCFAGW